MDAVKHAMKRDGIDPTITDLGLNNSLKCQQDSDYQNQEQEFDKGPLHKVDGTYDNYFKMLKIGLPMDAVKHAMKRDGIDPTITDLDLNNSLKCQQDSDYQNQEQEFDKGPLHKVDGTYDNYFKMLKIGLPMDAVKHAMKRDGIDPTLMDDEEKLLAAAQTEEPKKLMI
eukprot:725729_1